MSTQAIIFVIAIAMIVIIALGWGRGGGPRVTHIDRTITREEEGDDQ